MKVELEVDAEELWSAVFGSAFETFSWYTHVEYIEGDWDKPGKVVIGIIDPDDEEKVVKRTLDMEAVSKAWATSIERKHGHCGYGMADLDAQDACFGDVVVQIAVFGKLIYG